ncbi:MAG: hypothetical protein Tp152SUR00d2C52646391_6 [Prokaryotic dsDNA virus sp.]|nr:MAG: hypothetical protein Tp152SUR00d2C52646391_6 [Prokaryotic dsDNA virus sp.]|tara:strand:- start:1179 stop:1427 length:249 start_codon:yes stop_codon:yes gene_type:complete
MQVLTDQQIFGGKGTRKQCLFKAEPNSGEVILKNISSDGTYVEVKRFDSASTPAELKVLYYDFAGDYFQVELTVDATASISE